MVRRYNIIKIKKLLKTLKDVRYVFLFLILINIIYVVYLIFNPLFITVDNIEINTLDYSNPTIKTITYEAEVKNISRKNINFLLVFERADSVLFPYITLIPETYTTDNLHLLPKEFRKFKFTTTINSDDTRLINSLYQNVNVKYTLIKN